MNRQEFRQWALSGIRFFDGSTGAALAARGMPGNEVPEKYILEHPDALISLQKDYVAAGTEVLLSATLGTNAEQMASHGLDDVERYNRELVKISHQAADGRALVALELGPTGQYMAPMGMKTFDDIVDIYKEQVRYALMESPDLITLETFIDLSEARAAVIAVRELCDLPIVASMTFDNGMSLSGNSPEAVAVTLEAAGADAVGANCSTGPDEVAQVIKKMAAVTNLPLFGKPNAGKPCVVDGVTTFPMGADEFTQSSALLIQAGATLIGGCCGTLPEHIEALTAAYKDQAPAERSQITETYLASPRQVLKISNEHKFIPVGERINPTGQKSLASALASGDTMPAVSLASQQLQDGAKVLDVNVGAAGVDETVMLKKLAEELTVYAPSPICFDSTNPQVMESALRSFCGRAILNSASAEEGRMEPMIRLAAQYGAVVILLPFAGKLNMTCEDRINTLGTLLECCEKYGVGKDQVLIDGVIMAASTDSAAPVEALKFIRWCKEHGYMTIAGVSNVSFGLPNREAINEAYLLQLIDAGLTLGIVRPGEATNNIINVAYLLSSHDEWCMNWIGENR